MTINGDISRDDLRDNLSLPVHGRKEGDNIVFLSTLHLSKSIKVIQYSLNTSMKKNKNNKLYIHDAFYLS